MNSRTARLGFASIWIILLLTGGAPAQAQDAIVFASVEIDLWPEFDRPATLVIVNARLEPDVPLPAELSLRIPTAAGAPHAVAARDANGEMLNTPYTTTAAGDLTIVRLTTDFPEFRVEYYDPALTIAGSARDYSFEWTPDYPVRAAAIRVQQPFDALDLKFNPSFGPAGVGEYGLNYFTAPLGPRAAGQGLSVRLSYSKSSATLSADGAGANPPVVSAAPSASPSPGLSSWLMAGLVAAAGALVVGGVLWYVRSSRRETSKRQGAHRPGHGRRHHRRAGKNESPAGGQRTRSGAEARPPADGTARFCAQCGTRLRVGDRFCRNCGAKVREKSELTERMN